MMNSFEAANALSAAAVLTRLGIDAVAKQRRKFPCVACDSSDGLHAYPGDGRGAYCWSCSRSFSAVDLVIAARGCSPLDAARWLTGEFTISADRRDFQRRDEEARADRLVEQGRRHKEAARRAAYIWSRATSAPADHSYLTKKQVGPGAARIGADGRLVLPVVDLGGRLHSLQYIDPSGGKMLLSGGRKRGNLIPIAGRMPGASRVLVCEGWATGQTLATMEPAALVLAAIDAGNLEPVAVAVRRRWPAAEIVVCCDSDTVGIQKGRAAAVAAGALVAVPEFPAGAPGSDFNDLAAAMRRKAAA